MKPLGYLFSLPTSFLNDAACTAKDAGNSEVNEYHGVDAQDAQSSQALVDEQNLSRYGFGLIVMIQHILGPSSLQISMHQKV